MKFLALIPARYASTRFPGKPLADLGGKPMIRHVYEKARAFFDTCYVATDDERIERAVAGFGGRAIMTSTDHRSGTDRLPGSARQGGGPLRRAVRHRCQYSGRRAFRIRGAAFADLRVFRRAFDPNRHVGQGVRSARGYFQFQLSEGGLVGRRSCALFQPFGDSLPSRSRAVAVAEFAYLL